MNFEGDLKKASLTSSMCQLIIEIMITIIGDDVDDE